MSVSLKRKNFHVWVISKSFWRDFETFFVELKFRQKIFFCCSCNPHKSKIANNYSRKDIGYLNVKISSFLIASDFNWETAMINFRDPTCYKNPNKSLYLGLILTNFPKSFMKTQALETGFIKRWGGGFRLYNILIIFLIWTL